MCPAPCVSSYGAREQMTAPQEVALEQPGLTHKGVRLSCANGRSNRTAPQQTC